MSLRELAAAIWPNVNGSSTTGVKKSTVCTNARSSLIRYTPASSLVLKPTSTFGSVGSGRRRSIESSVPGLSLAAQPAALTMAVSFTESVKPHLTVLHFDYSEGVKVMLPGDRNLLPRAACAKRLKMFLSRDAVGLLVDLSFSERCDSLARLHTPEKAASFAIG